MLHHYLYFLSDLSKSALKNKRKREAKQRARQQEGETGQSQDRQDAVAMAAHLLGPAATSGSGEGTKGGGDREKQLKNLRKVNYRLHGL